MNTPARRKLRYNTLDEALADARALAAGPITTSGQWTPGQIFGHVARAIHGSIDGVPFQAPLPVRVVGKVMRNRLLNRAIPTGIKLPKNAKARVVPEPDYPVDQAIEQLAKAIERTKNETMNQRHPVFGWINHGQWMKFHCRHAENHFSYLHPTARQTIPTKP